MVRALRSRTSARTGLGSWCLQIQHVTPGPNEGLFRVGRKLDTNGNVTGGWSNWAQVPDISGAEP
jgi:hypothetical protein